MWATRSSRDRRSAWRSSSSDGRTDDIRTNVGRGEWGARFEWSSGNSPRWRYWAFMARLPLVDCRLS
jgi:hypothetical protein